VPKLRSVVGLEVREFSQKPGDLGDDSKKIFRCGVIMHLKTLNCLVVFDDRIKRSFFQFLPVPAKIIFSVGIEQKEEIFNI